MAPMATATRDLTQPSAPDTRSRAETAKERELHNHPNKVHVEFEQFYGIAPTHVDRRFELRLSDLSYLPKVCSPSPCQLSIRS